METTVSRHRAVTQMLVFGILGLLMFFVPVELGGKRTILFDHAATYLVKQWRRPAEWAMLAMMAYGAFAPVWRGSWRKGLTEKILTAFKIGGFAVTLCYVSGLAPAALTDKAMLPFLYDKLGLPLAMIIPIGALVLACLVGFGLMELIGVLMEPVMRRIWKTPGYSAVDAVASFVGSYSVGLLLTDQMYRNGRYTAREAAIVATGFSTVSAAFMVVVAKTLNLMGSWGFYFWSCFAITFAVTAVCARIPPICRMDDTGSAAETPVPFRQRLSAAWEKGVSASARADKPARILAEHFAAGINMAAAILPAIMAIGLAGLLLEKHTPMFDALGVLLWPFALLGGLAEPLLAAKGMAAGLAEMFLPAILLKDADVLTRYVAAVVSVSSIIFFSALIPCILATKIPLSVPKMLLIWLQRTALSMVLAAWVGRLALALGWLAS
ncbi:YjiH family protein [Conchiformibius kuhniae]|uniref:YjiH family protein n=1 Tax=Conchiformibius kuhniae TaxID=211502 RepID=A0A8T9MS99_9NEIS|nr:YjiH family protein [Conchiformibius kuhniae]